MLPGKPWKTNAVLRLFASVLVCTLFIGALGHQAVSWVNQPRRPGAVAALAAMSVAVLLLAGALVVLGRPWRPERISRNLLLLITFTYGGMILTWWAMHQHGSENGPHNLLAKMAVGVLCFQGAALIFLHRFVREHETRWPEAFGFRQDWPRSVMLGFSAAGLFVPVGWGLQAACALLMKRFDLPAAEQNAVQVLRLAEHPGGRILLVVLAVILVPIAEETLFRGVLYPTIKQSGFPRLALWSSALLFGSVHLSAVTFLPLTVLALVLTWLYERTGNLLAPMVAHALFNAVNIGTLYYVEWLNRSLVP